MKRRGEEVHGVPLIFPERKGGKEERGRGFWPFFTGIM